MPKTDVVISYPDAGDRCIFVGILLDDGEASAVWCRDLKPSVNVVEAIKDLDRIGIDRRYRKGTAEELATYRRIRAKKTDGG